MIDIADIHRRLDRIKEKVRKLKGENEALRAEVERLQGIKNRAAEKVDSIIERLNQKQG